MLALLLTVGLIVSTVPAMSMAADCDKPSGMPLKRISTVNTAPSGQRVDPDTYYGDSSSVTVQIADVYIDPRPLVAGSWATLLCVVDNPYKVPYQFWFEVAGCAAGPGYIEHGGDIQIDFEVPEDFGGTTTNVTIAVGSPNGMWQQGEFSVGVIPASGGQPAAPTSQPGIPVPSNGPQSSLGPAPTPSASSAQPGFTSAPSASPAPSYTPGPTMPAPVPDPIVSGMFIFEARGHQISVSSAETGIRNWAKDTDLPEGVEVSIESSGKSPLATGDEVLLTYANGFSTRYAVAIKGDAAGTGKPGLSQIVTLAMLMRSGTDDPLQAAAADISGDGAITLTDVIRVANDLKTPDPNGPLMPSAPEIFPRGSSNALRENYSRWSAPITSHLYENAAGGVTRVEYTDKRIVVEDYDSSFKLLFTNSAAPELPIWGGFYSGSEYNYMIFGQANNDQSDSKEVIRIVKYDKDWNRLNAASLLGANTTIPFDAGSLRCAEYGGYLYIRTAHEMYETYDGLNHQANLMMSVRESDMQITDAFFEVSNISDGYVSHSFNQFVKIDRAGHIFTIDHGDAHPRGGVFLEYDALAGQELFLNPYSYLPQVTGVVFQQFPGEEGDNTTGASIGGFELIETGCLCSYNFNETGGTGPRDVYVFLANTTTGDVETRKLTSGANTSTPQAASTRGGAGFVTWMNLTSSDDIQFCYADYTSSGSLGSVRKADAISSDCQPIAWEDGILWYTTEDGSQPTFYTLTSSGAVSTPSRGGLQKTQ